MTRWIPAKDAKPLKPGWYPVLSDWRTSTLHPGAKRWLGRKWASAAPERIAFFCPQPFADPHEATGHAFTLDMLTHRDEAAREDEVQLAAAAG